MRVGVNYSQAAQRLLAAREITIDCWKLYECEVTIAHAQESLPVIVHFSYDAGSEDAFNWDKIAATGRFLATTPTPSVNAHLSARFEHLSRLPSPDEIVSKAVFDLLKLHLSFPSHTILLEHVPRDQGSSALVIDPLLISRVVRYAKVGFILDTAHAVLAADELGLSPIDYIRELPTDLLAEIHISGTGTNTATGNLTDKLIDHEPMRDLDWMVANWCLNQIAIGKWPTPTFLMYEYGGSSPDWEVCTSETTLRAELRQLTELCTPIFQLHKIPDGSRHLVYGGR